MQQVRAIARFFAKLGNSRVGMNVALFQVAFGSWVQGVLQIFGGQYKKEISTCCGQFW